MQKEEVLAISIFKLLLSRSKAKYASAHAAMELQLNDISVHGYVG